MTRSEIAVGTRVGNVFLAAVVLGLASGCTMLKEIIPGVSAEPTHKVKSIEIVSTENVNQNTAVAVDVVFIYEERLVDALRGITARVWFRDKPGYLARYPQSLAVSCHEFVPIDSATIEPASVKTGPAPSAKKARAVVLFANYLVEDADYTLDISGFRKPLVTLKETTISVRDKSVRSEKE